MQNESEARSAPSAVGIENERIRRVAAAAHDALVEMGEDPSRVLGEIAEYMAEQRYEMPPQELPERLPAQEMIRRLENPALDRFLGRPENADDMEDPHGRSLLIGLPDRP